MRYLLVCLLLIGCGSSFKLEATALTCGVDIFSWSGGLTRSVLQGEGDGSFHYAGSHGVASIEGDYDLATGVFGYDVVWSPGHARVNERVDGQGTLWTDGDMDIEYTREVQWVDESVTTLTSREKRLGCSVSEQHTGEDGTTYLYGTYDSDGLEYRREYAEGSHTIEAEGRLGSAGGYGEEVAYESGLYVLEYQQSGSLSGNALRVFTDTVDGVTVDGQWTRDDVGVVSYDYGVTGEGYLEEWLFELDFSGTGEGEVVIGDTSCDLEVTDFACERKRCGDLRGSCTFPALAPRQ
jgi:hypothetical protein